MEEEEEEEERREAGEVWSFVGEEVRVRGGALRERRSDRGREGEREPRRTETQRIRESERRRRRRKSRKRATETLVTRLYHAD